jgi:hypothetical protein
LTDRRGKFNFSNLPYGTYYVMADLPRYGRGLCEEITLSPEQPSVADIHLFVSDEGKVKIRQDEADPMTKTAAVFPNPAEEEITISGLKGQTEYHVCVLNGLGVTVLERKVQTNLLGECVVAVADLSVGMYVVRLTDPTGSVMTKFVKH